MNTWGSKLLDAVQDVAEMAAEGFGLPADTFRSRMRHAPHLLAPTASDFNRFGAKGTVLAGFHYDLNALTIHGRSRYPGLYVWTRDGRKKGVKIPAGCLLVQAGKQMEYVTGGHVSQSAAAERTHGGQAVRRKQRRNLLLHPACHLRSSIACF
jgi:isopenicillin N synthase-like dioxygenase